MLWVEAGYGAIDPDSASNYIVGSRSRSRSRSRSPRVSLPSATLDHGTRTRGPWAWDECPDCEEDRWLYRYPYPARWGAGGLPRGTLFMCRECGPDTGFRPAGPLPAEDPPPPDPRGSDLELDEVLPGSGDGVRAASSPTYESDDDDRWKRFGLTSGGLQFSDDGELDKMGLRAGHDGALMARPERPVLSRNEDSGYDDDSDSDSAAMIQLEALKLLDQLSRRDADGSDSGGDRPSGRKGQATGVHGMQFGGDEGEMEDIQRYRRAVPDLNKSTHGKNAADEAA